VSGDGGVAERVTARDAAQTRAFAERFARSLGPGDLVILSGELGAGKTTFTQGVAAGLGVRGPVTSPTFVIAHVHASLVSGPALVHVDAYRIGSLAELDDLDLDASVDDSVTVVEWGEGKAEVLAEGRAGYYVVHLDRSREDDVREISVERVVAGA
jgi:tRNA threonylcarbamoyladenosine biosynthesis protein TsaE